MVTISFFFWTLIVLFGFIGAMRGWAKEMLVSFSLVMALFVMQVALTYVGPVKKLWGALGGTTQFYTASLVMILFALAGYHIPNKSGSSRGSRPGPGPGQGPMRKKSIGESLQNMMVGGFLGAGNGYLLVGTIWFFLHLASYPVPEYLMTSPQAGDSAGDAALKMIDLLPPAWLQGPVLYVAVAVVFTFVIIVLI